MPYAFPDAHGYKHKVELMILERAGVVTGNL